MSGIGGYVRRCERHGKNPPGHLRQRGDGWPAMLEVTFQSMPLLRFEPFDVVTEDATKTVDEAVKDVVASWYANRQRSKGPDPTSARHPAG